MIEETIIKILVIAFMLLCAGVMYIEAMYMIRLRSYKKLIHRFRAGKAEEPWYIHAWYLWSGANITPKIHDRIVDAIGDKRLTKLIHFGGWLLIAGAVVCVLLIPIIPSLPI